MAAQKPVKVQKQAIDNAEQAWQSFMKISKVSTYAVCIILFILWAFLIGA